MSERRPSARRTVISDERRLADVEAAALRLAGEGLFYVGDVMRAASCTYRLASRAIGRLERRGQIAFIGKHDSPRSGNGRRMYTLARPELYEHAKAMAAR